MCGVGQQFWCNFCARRWWSWGRDTKRPIGKQPKKEAPDGLLKTVLAQDSNRMFSIPPHISVFGFQIKIRHCCSQNIVLFSSGSQVESYSKSWCSESNNFMSVVNAWISQHLFWGFTVDIIQQPWLLSKGWLSALQDLLSVLIGTACYTPLRNLNPAQLNINRNLSGQ